MKKTSRICIILVLCLLFGMLTVPTRAAEGGVSCHGLQADIALDSSGKHLETAKSVILFEMNTETLVYSYNADKLLNPTGLVKLLTVLVALEKGNLDDVVTVHQSTLNTVAVGAKSSRLKAGEEMTLRDLLQCVMVYSANDACAVIASHIGGDQEGFVQLLNEKARALGCISSNFTNAHGLNDDAQYSTARDLAIIAAAALKNPVFSQMFSMTECQIPATNKSEARSYKTTNNMMRDNMSNYDSRVTGGKPAAATNTDRSMIATAKVDSADYLCVVMNVKAEMSEDNLQILRYGIYEEMSDLLDYAQNGFEVRQILDDSQAMYQYAVTGGENAVVLRPSRDVSVVLPKECDVDKLNFIQSVDLQQITAPVAQSQKLGQLTIYYGNLAMGTCDLLAMQGVAATGSSIQNAERLEVTQQQKAGLWKDLIGYAAFAILGILVLIGLISALVRWIQNRKIRAEQRRRARSRKRRK